MRWVGRLQRKWPAVSQRPIVFSSAMPVALAQSLTSVPNLQRKMNRFANVRAALTSLTRWDVIGISQHMRDKRLMPMQSAPG